MERYEFEYLVSLGTKINELKEAIEYQQKEHERLNKAMKESMMETIARKTFKSDYTSWGADGCLKYYPEWVVEFFDYYNASGLLYEVMMDELEKEKKAKEEKEKEEEEN